MSDELPGCHQGGRRVIFTSAEGVDAAGHLVATATSSLLVIAPTAPSQERA